MRGVDVSEPGRLIYVVGASGAGKDSVLRWVRQRHPSGVTFAHRYITRPAESGGENHVALSEVEFATRLASGAFALWWEANDLHYGIGSEIALWQAAGLDVVINGSRAHLIQALASHPDLLPVLITAPVGHIACRLAARGREDVAAQSQRISRNASLAATSVPGMVVIDNGGDLGNAGLALMRLLAREDDGAYHAAGHR